MKQKLKEVIKSENSIRTYPAWATWLWRLVRGAFWTAVSSTLMLQVDLTHLDNALKVLGVAFVSGFLQALGLALRDSLAAGDKASIANKLPI